MPVNVWLMPVEAPTPNAVSESGAQPFRRAALAATTATHKPPRRISVPSMRAPSCLPGRDHALFGHAHLLAHAQGRLGVFAERAVTAVVHSNADLKVRGFLRVLLDLVAGIRARAGTRYRRGRAPAAAADLVAEDAPDHGAADGT